MEQTLLSPPRPQAAIPVYAAPTITISFARTQIIRTQILWLGIIAYTSRQISLATARIKPLARRSPTSSNTASPVPTKKWVLVEPVEFERQHLLLADAMFTIAFSLFYSIPQSLRNEPCFTQEILALHHQLLDPGTPVFKNIPGIAIRKRWRWKSINGALRIDVGLQKMRRRVVHLRHTNFSLVQITHNTKDNWRGPAEVEESS